MEGSHLKVQAHGLSEIGNEAKQQVDRSEKDVDERVTAPGTDRSLNATCIRLRGTIGLTTVLGDTMGGVQGLELAALAAQFPYRLAELIDALLG